MYNIKGPSKIVAKSTRRGISQNIDNHRDASKNSKSLDANDNEITNGPKPIFQSSKKNISFHSHQYNLITPQHEEIIKYIEDSWIAIKSIADNQCIDSEENNNCNRNCSVMYYVDKPCSNLQDFKPFDLEAWWGRRLYNLITNSVNSKS